MSATRLTVPHPPDARWHEGATVKFHYKSEWKDGVIVKVRATDYYHDDELVIVSDGKTYTLSAMGLVVRMTCHPFEKVLPCGCTVGHAGEIASLGEECPHRA